jgi:hypothetical protein
VNPSGLGWRRDGHAKGSDELGRRFCCGHDGVREAYPELLLQTQQQLDTFQAADAKITIQDVI